MNKFLKLFSFVIFCILAAYLCVFPSRGLRAASDGITLCISSVIPALFPYLVCSGVLSKSYGARLLGHWLSPVMRPLFGISGAGALPLVLGLLSGYPVGAVCTKDLFISGAISRDEANRLIAFCNNSGPVFVISVVGIGFLHSQRLGVILYISHIISAVVTGKLLGVFSRNKAQGEKLLPQAFGEEGLLGGFLLAFDAAVLCILKICGFVVFFSVLASMLDCLPVSSVFHSLIEITGGLRSFTSQFPKSPLCLGAVSFFLAFSGLSVVLQVCAVTAPSGLDLRPYLIGKILQGGFSFVFTYLVVSANSQLVSATQKSTAVAAACPLDAFSNSLTMIFFTVLILLSVCLAVWLFKRLVS